MLIDTGAGVNVLSDKDYYRFLRWKHLKKRYLKLSSYDGKFLYVLGKIKCFVSFKKQCKNI